MAITEKTKALEFTCDLSDRFRTEEGIISYDVSHDPNEGLFPLTITSTSGEILRCPVELLTDIVSFLQQKGIIASEKRPLTGPFAQTLLETPKPPRPQQGGGIPLPQIQRKDGSTPEEFTPTPIPQASLDTVPIASFDIGEGTSVVAAPATLPKIPVPDILPPPMPKPKPTAKELEEMKKRPTVRFSQAGKKDGLIAQREAAQLRRQMVDGSKTVKRVDE